MAQNLPPPGGDRSRGSSNASMNKYIPENYGAPPPPPPNGAGQGYGPRPRGPSLDNQQIPSIPPNPQFYGPPPDMQVPQHQRQPSYSVTYQDQPYPPNRDSNRLRPPIEPRRSSNSSTHSRRSQDSRRSRRSQRSSSPDDRERRSHDRDREKKHHRSHHHRHSDEDRDFKPPKRVDSHRPSWGDTIYALYGAIKNAIGGK